MTCSNFHRLITTYSQATITSPNTRTHESGHEAGPAWDPKYTIFLKNCDFFSGRESVAFQRACADCTALKSMMEVRRHTFTIAIDQRGREGPEARLRWYNTCSVMHWGVRQQAESLVSRPSVGLEI